MATFDSQNMTLANMQVLSAADTGRRVAHPVSVLGVGVANFSMPEAVDVLQRLLAEPAQQPQTLFFVNAHTLNLAYEDGEYRDLFNRATCVFGDGTGVRWAARLQGVQLKANLNGTDVLPELMAATDSHQYRYFLLGATPSAVEGAARHAQRRFPGWQLVGYQDGYANPLENEAIIERINLGRPHLLLVAMGNPIQERWIMHYRDRLDVKLCVGVGGLFNFWSGEVDRAPAWLRWLGHEWLHVLWVQKFKWRRYLLGNPKYLYRVLTSRSGDRAT